MAIAPLSYPGYAAPRDLDFSPLAKLAEQYRAGQTRAAMQEIGQGLADGSMDYKAAAGRIAQTGNLDATTKFLSLAQLQQKQQEELAASNQFSTTLASLYGGGGVPPAAPVAQPAAMPVPSATPASPAARAPVQSSPKVWGDEEAVKAGLYDAPARPTQVAQSAPAAASAAPAPASPAPQGGGFQNIGMQQVPTLLQAVSNPRLPAAQKELAGKLLTRALDEAKTPDKIRTLQMLKEQSGYQGSILDLEKELRGASKTEVSVNQVGEKEYEKQSAKEFAEMNRDMIKGAQSARMKIGTLSRMDQLLADPKIYTGTGANQVLAAKKLAKAIGIDVGDVSGPEAINAIGNQFALELRNPAGGAGMPGALSDKDREFLQQSVPGLGQTPEGNRKIIDYMKRVAQRSLDVERLRQDYVKNNGRLNEGFYRELEAYSTTNPLFPEAARQDGQGASPSGNTTKTGVKWSIE